MVAYLLRSSPRVAIEEYYKRKFEARPSALPKDAVDMLHLHRRWPENKSVDALQAMRCEAAVVSGRGVEGLPKLKILSGVVLWLWSLLVEKTGELPVTKLVDAMQVLPHLVIMIRSTYIHNKTCTPPAPLT